MYFFLFLGVLHVCEAQGKNMSLWHNPPPSRQPTRHTRPTTQQGRELPQPSNVRPHPTKQPTGQNRPPPWKEGPTPTNNILTPPTDRPASTRRRAWEILWLLGGIRGLLYRWFASFISRLVWCLDIFGYCASHRRSGGWYTNDLAKITLGAWREKK